MKDFKIVKCEKCDAALVELPNNPLIHCIQCGYQFGGIEKDKNKTSFHARLDKINKVREKKTSKKTAKGKKTPIWLTLLKWYIITSIVTGIILGLFKNS